MPDPRPISPWFLLVVPAILAATVLAVPLFQSGVFDLREAGWVQILLCFGIAGAFGGVLASIQHIDLPGLLSSSDRSRWTTDNLRNALLALSLGATGGIGGAGAALFVMLLDGKIKSPPDDLGRLSAITSGLLGGFVGFQLLRRVAEQALNSAAKAEIKQTAEAVGDKVSRKVDERGELTDAVLEALAALSKRGTPQGDIAMELAIPQLESLQAEFPANRSVAIVLGRLYRWAKNDLRKGIEVLSRAYTAMKNSPEDRSRDIGTVLFNRACYWCLLSLPPNPDSEQAITNCRNDLKDSFKLSHANALQASKDPDFESIRGEEWFKKLLAEYGVTG